MGTVKTIQLLTLYSQLKETVHHNQKAKTETVFTTYCEHDPPTIDQHFYSPTSIQAHAINTLCTSVKMSKYEMAQMQINATKDQIMLATKGKD